MHLLVPICPDRSAPASAEGRDAYATGIDLELVPSVSIRDRNGTARSVWRTCLGRHVFLIADEAEVPAASNLNAAPLMPAERGWAGGLDGGSADWRQQVPLDTQPDRMHGLRLPGRGHWQLPVGPEVVSSGWQPGSAGDEFTSLRLQAASAG